MSPADAAAKVRALQADPPASIGGRAVLSTEEYPEADLLRFELEGGVRVQIRPSGTEPKVKLYGEAVDEDPAALRRRPPGAPRLHRWARARGYGRRPVRRA